MYVERQKETCSIKIIWVFDMRLELETHNLDATLNLFTSEIECSEPKNCILFCILFSLS